MAFSKEAIAFMVKHAQGNFGGTVAGMMLHRGGEHFAVAIHGRNPKWLNVDGGPCDAMTVRACPVERDGVLLNVEFYQGDYDLTLGQALRDMVRMAGWG